MRCKKCGSENTRVIPIGLVMRVDECQCLACGHEWMLVLEGDI